MTIGVVPSWRNEDEDEPFDQRSKRRNMRMDEDILEDGELPSLTTRRVNGQVSTSSRRLQPPAGHVEIEQRKFWGQLDPHEDDDTTSDEDNVSVERRSFDEDHGGDMPDDEMMAARRSGLAGREIDNLSRQKDEAVDYGDNRDEYYSSIGNTHTFQTAESEEVERTTFCDETLTAIGNMCGGNLGAINSSTDDAQTKEETSKRVVSPSAEDHYSDDGEEEDDDQDFESSMLPLRTPPSMQSEMQEEHTAIEVEFVEPDHQAAGKRILTPETKNAYLTKMALKAKQDFFKKKDGKNAPIEKSPSQDDDIYKSFNATEKRKFLRLINSGTPPAEATNKILQERVEAKPQEKKRSAELDNLTGDDKPGERYQRRSLLTFWKKTKTSPKKDQREVVQRSAPSNVTPEPTPVPVVSEKTSSVPKAASPVVQALPVDAPVDTSAAVPPPPPSNSGAGLKAASVAAPTATGVAATAVVLSRRGGDEADAKPVPRPVSKHEAVSSSVGVPHISTSKSADEPLSGKRSAEREATFLKRYVRPSAASVGDSEKKPETSRAQPTSPGMNTTAPLSDESAEEVNTGFARSGINYYDAVRKQEEEDENGKALSPVDDTPSQSSKPKSKSERRSFLRSTGFAVLTDRRAKSAPRAGSTRASDLTSTKKSPPEARPQRERTNREAESALTGALAVASNKGIEPEDNYHGEPPRAHEKELEATQSVPSATGEDTGLLESVAMSVLEEGSISHQKPRARETQETSSVQAALAVPKQAVSGSQELPSIQEDQVARAPGSQVVSSQRAATPLEIYSTGAPTTASKTVETLLQPSSKVAEGGSVDENAALAKIEEELLRPLPPKAPVSAKALPPTESPPQTDQNEGQVSKKKKKGISVQVDGGESGIGSYLESRDHLSSGKSPSEQELNYDTMSVYTAGTGVTGITSGTTYTQSSRVRRPGAAKTRLAKAKEAENAVRKNKGWHESIKAVAASSNRVWDPKLGWVDYTEQAADIELPEPPRQEKIHLGLSRSALSHKEAQNTPEPAHSNSKSAPIPFPQAWEKERVEMIERAHPFSKRTAEDASEEKKLEHHAAQRYPVESAKNMPPPPPPRVEQIIPDEPSRPRGWLETMKAASAALAKDGQKWDPENGWTRVDPQQSKNADIVASGTPSEETVDLDAAKSTTESNSEVEGDALAGRTASLSKAREDLAMNLVTGKALPGPTHPTDIKESAKVLPVLENDRSEDSALLKEPDRKLNQWIARAEQEPKNQSEPSMESSVRAVASSGAPVERYVQLGDGGSVLAQDGIAESAKKGVAVPTPLVGVRTATQGESAYISDDETETDADNSPLLNSSGAFPSLHDRAISPVVDVVKEKVGKEDMELFPKQQPKSQRVGSVASVGSVGLQRPSTKDFKTRTSKSSPGRSNAQAGMASNQQANQTLSKKERVEESAEGGSESDRNPKQVVHPVGDQKTPEDPSRSVPLGASPERSTPLGPHSASSSKSDLNQGDGSSLTGEGVSFVHSVARSVSSESKRGAGPVDIDEVDETWDSDDDQRHSTDWKTDSTDGRPSQDSWGYDEKEKNEKSGWEADSRSMGTSSANSASSKRPSDDGRRRGGGWDLEPKTATSSPYSATFMPTKPVPKLRKNERDTSPISRRSQGTSVVPPSLVDEGKKAQLFPAGVERRSGGSGGSTPTPSEHLAIPALGNSNPKTTPRTDGKSSEESPAVVSPSSVTAPEQQKAPEIPSETVPQSDKKENHRKELHDLELFQEQAVSAHDRTPEVDLDRELELVMEQDAARRENRNSKPSPGRPVDAEKESTPSSPSPHQDSEIAPVVTPDSPSVKLRREEWESRVGKTGRERRSVGSQSGSNQVRGNNPSGSAEWKSFLGKKVQAERAAAARSSVRMEINHRKEPEGEKLNYQKGGGRGPVFQSPSGEGYSVEAQQEDDSIFDFAEKSRSSTSVFRPRSRSDISKQHSSRPRGAPSSAMEDLSDISPIQSTEEHSDADREPSEAYGPESTDMGSFFRRLAECAAPVMPKSRNEKDSKGLPKSHLAFMRSSQETSGQSRFMPPNICGRPDIISEDNESDGEQVSVEQGEVRHHSHSDAAKAPRSDVGDEKPRSRSAPKGRSSGEVRTTTSSVISEDFGAKTAYLEALAMKSAVSKPRSSSRRRERSSGGSSVVSSSSSAHSEKWKAFLERKKANGTPVKSRSSNASNVSKAAEKYAADKVEEMMSRPASAGREGYIERHVDSMMNSSAESGRSASNRQSPQKQAPETLRAAEDLAAARVEAMMAALSTSHLSEGEI